MKISVHQVQPGMILSAHAALPDGRVIVQAQQEITPDIIKILNQNKISLIEVSNKPSPQSDNSQSSASEQSTASSLPSFFVRIAADKMSAILIIEPSASDNSDITSKDIYAALEKEHITTGIDNTLIEACVAQWNENKHRYEISNIARGILPQPAKEGAFLFKVRHLFDTNEIQKIKNAHYMWQLPDLIPYVERVVPKTIIAERQTGIPSIPGTTIKGEPVFTKEVIRTEIKTGAGVSISPDGRSVIADIEGVVAFASDCIEVIHINFNGTVEVVLNNNAATAELLFHDAVYGGSLPGEVDIRNKLKECKVVHGIKEDTLRDIVTRLAHSEVPQTPVVIAEATKPVDGQNGSHIFHFNTETSLKPKKNPDGSVDYKSVNIVNSVAKGQKLVSLSAPTRGIPGTNLFNEKIACVDGVPATLPIGSNTEVDPQDPNLLRASIDGVVRYNGSTVELSEGYVIKGDVDFSTGNVNYERSVIVNGDVKSGFEIECGGDFQAGGTIEDSILKIGGNVLCRYGFSGQGKGIIDAKGDVNLGFMKNQSVRSCKNVNIAREAINSTIFSRESIHIHGNPLSVAGGCLTARDSITVNSAGNHSGIRTILEVGFDFTLGEDIKKVDSHLEELLSNQSKIVENIKKIEKLASLQRKLSIKDQALKTKLIESLDKYKQHIQLVEMQKKMIVRKMYNFEKAFIKIERTAFPGTLFKFGERHHLVKEEINGPKTVHLVDHEIRVS